MRLYLDQMLRSELADLLRADGHEVVRAEETGHSRADDAEVMTLVIAQARTLVTLDEHFGDWAVLPLSEHPGVIRLKIHPPETAKLAGRLLPFLRQHSQSEFQNRLVILGSVRERWIATVE